MERIAILLNPSSNRVYGLHSARLALAELALAGKYALDESIENSTETLIGGVSYLTFGVQQLTTHDARILSNLSATFALFRLDGGSLIPIEKSLLDQLPDDLITIQRYQGKTNEQFTKLLINAAAFVSSFAPTYLDRRFLVLDPLCGRGSTLNQALLLGWDAIGLDLDAKDVEAYATFIQRWLKDHRLKHKASFGPLRRDGRVLAKRLEVSFAATKEQYKSEVVQRLEVLAADTTQTAEFVRAGSIDLIVADAPYGVRHGSTTGGSLTRSPLNLLDAAAPGWLMTLRRGGGLALAWNTKVAPRHAAAGALEKAGFEVLEPDEATNLLNRVDRSIERDVLLARRP